MTARKLVIVVDDDRSMLRSVERLLKAHGFDVAVFDRVEDFLARANLCEAACLVLDIQLDPDGMSGIELRRRLTLSGIELPVIFITGNDSARSRQAATEAGCSAYLPKPFAAASLIDAINAPGQPRTAG